MWRAEAGAVVARPAVVARANAAAMVRIFDVMIATPFLSSSIQSVKSVTELRKGPSQDRCSPPTVHALRFEKPQRTIDCATPTAIEKAAEQFNLPVTKLMAPWRR